MLRSLKVSNGWLKRVKQALSRYDFSSQKALAEDLEISSRKASDFFNGKSVDYEVFVAICERLGLEWQKVAKVSPEQVKNPPLANKAPEISEISTSKIMEARPQQNEGIPRLASSLFKSFDSQAPIAQKKFFTPVTPVTPPDQVSETLEEQLDQSPDQPEPSSSQALDQDIDQVMHQLVDEVDQLGDEDNSEDQLSEAIADILEQTTQEPEPEKTKESTLQIQELLGIASNLTTSTVLNPETIAQIQELLGMSRPATGKKEPVESQSKQLVQTIAEPLPDLAIAIDESKNETEITEQIPEPVKVPIAPVQIEAIAEPIVKTKIELEIKPEPKIESAQITPVSKQISQQKVEAIAEPPQDLAIAFDEPKNEIETKEQITEPVKDPIAQEQAEQPQLEPIAEPIVKTKIEPEIELELKIESGQTILVLEQISEPKVESQIAEKVVNKAVNKIEIREFTPPVDDLEMILTAYYGSCKAQDWDMAASIVNGLNVAYIKKRTDLAQILDLYHQLLPLKWQDGAQKVPDLHSHWQVLYNAGLTAFYLEKYTDACAYYETALAIAPKLESETPLKIKVLNGLGAVYQAVAQYQSALKYFQQSQTLAKESQDHDSQLQALSNLGNIYYALRQYRTAIAYYQEFLQLANQNSSSKEAIELEFSTIGNLGNAYYNLKEYQKAISYQEQYLEIARMVGSPEKEAGCLVSLGFVYYAVGLFQTAIEQYNQAKAIADQFTYPHLQLSTFSGLGLSYQSLKNYSTAVVCFHKCLEIARQLGNRSAEVKALYNLRKANSYQFSENRV